MREPRRQARSDRDRHREDGEKERDHAGGAADIDVPPSVGSIDRTTAPTSQNQLATRAPHHSRRSARTYLIRLIVEAAMLGLILRFGAPSPVRGMNRLAIQQAVAVTSISQAKWMGSPPSPAANPATMVPIRMAMNVPPSTSALPLVSSSRFKMIGQDAVFDRAEQRGDHAVEKDRQKQHGDRVKREADHRQRRRRRSRTASIGAPRWPCRSGRRSRRRDRKERRTGRSAPRPRAGSSAPDSASPSRNSRTKTSACLRKLSPNAEKAWHQNRGAKRRVVIKDVDIALPPFDSRFRGGILDGRRRIGDAVSRTK